ncbi:permease-like cell division protein FtsX [Halobacillus seohaensis]|uniref:Cell division protein FtsX n=1 Tax=Halobacillus seohaensis TaxID=447421 RepID=A0ABW2EPB0_9BACI
MKINTINRHMKEGVKNLVRNGWMSFASISAVTVTLLLVGVFAALLFNLNEIGSQIEEDVEIRVFIERSVEIEDQNSLEDEIASIPKVQSVTFQSKEEGLDQLIDSLGEEGDAFASLKEENPLNDVYIVKTDQPQSTTEVASEIKGLQSVEKVEYAQETVERLFNVMDIVRNIGVGLIFGLLFTAMFLIANTIKITIVARKKEIGIMKLVGATNWFIRWPFFIEGILIGVLGSVLPITLLIFGYRYLYEDFTARYPTLFIDLLPVYPFIFQLGAILLLMGTLIGLWGSMTSMRKFLKT